jgi:hypothetical protein
MIRASILAAAVALATVATAQAQSIVQRPDGLWACSNDPNRIIVSGDWRVICLTDSAHHMTPEEAKAFFQGRQTRPHNDD